MKERKINFCPISPTMQKMKKLEKQSNNILLSVFENRNKKSEDFQKAVKNF